jgi:tRNA-splicing ligase RtcB
MACAANYAWANRQILMSFAVDTIADFFGIKTADFKYRLIYDVAHNIVKKEKFVLDKKEYDVYVHRKGATRALPPGHADLPNHLKPLGQPVIIPGDMGRYSYLLTGGNNATELSFNSACHGAGRVLSRNKAVREAKNRNIALELQKNCIYVMSRGKKTLKEEMPDAYKDVANVVDVVHNLKIAEKTARIKPICVVKG